MDIGIIGPGNVGGALGRLWAANGHRVVYGSRDPSAEKVTTLVSETGHGARAAGIAEAAASAQVVLIALPWDAVEAGVRAAGDLSGKVLIDANNPLAPDRSGLVVGQTNSAAEEIAAWAPGARVVKAFNHLGAAGYATAHFAGRAASMLICGDDAEAKTTVRGLVAELGFDVVDAGPLASARLLEPLAMLWIRLAYVDGLGPEIAFALLRR